MNYTNEDKKALLKLIGKNVKFYCNRCNNTKLINDKGIVTMERLAEEIESSPNMLYNLTAENVEQGVSIVFIDKVARALDVDLYCFFLKEPIPNPPKYSK